MNDPVLSLVIPCFNEADNLRPLLVAITDVLNESSGRVEFILVDNGSTDDTREILQSMSQKGTLISFVYLEKNMGYGHGVMSGLKIARGVIVGWTHADMQTHPRDALKALKSYRNDGELYFLKGVRKRRPPADFFFSFGMAVFESILFGRVFHEINAQPTAFSRELLQDAINPPNDFSLDLYVYNLAKKRGYIEVRFPVEFGKRHAGMSKWNTSLYSRLRFIMRTVGYSLKLKFRR